MTRDKNCATRSPRVRESIDKAQATALDCIILPSEQVRRRIRLRLRHVASEGWMDGYEVGAVEGRRYLLDDIRNALDGLAENANVADCLATIEAVGARKR